MARSKPKRGPERPEIDAAKRSIHEERPGEARVRGPEERTPGEDVLGEDLRADDELLGEQPRSPDDLLASARAEERQAGEDEEDLVATPARDARPAAAGSPEDDPELVERAAAWEHAPDLEKTSMILERGEGEEGSLSVSRPGDHAQFDPISSSAYDEPIPGAVDLQVPGAGITVDRTRRETEPPPDSVREGRRPPRAR